MAKEYTVGVVGAFGVVGQEMIETLERRNFPVKALIPLTVANQVGNEIEFKGKMWPAREGKEGAFKDIDIVIFSAGADASEQLAPIAVREGAIVVDNSSQWRMDESVPLVVPEVNGDALFSHKGIIANPNCSTTQLVVALKPLHDAAKIKRIVVSTYQAVSGSGKRAIEGFREELNEIAEKGTLSEPKFYKKQIAYNVLPHIDLFLDDGYTKEEHKMVDETKKILDKDIEVTATCVRVPVWYGHCESVNIETEKKLSVEEVKELLSKAPSIKVIDDPKSELYPTPLESDNEDETMVGRIREDFTIANGINLWVVSNNIRKGAALNAVQIAESLIEKKLV